MHALERLEQAIARDPDYGSALALAAYLQMQLIANGWVEDMQSRRDKGIDYAHRALQAAGYDPEVLADAAYALAALGENIATMLTLADRALTLNPNYARGWFISGVIGLWAGDADRAIDHVETSLRLSPRDRLGGHFHVLGVAHFFKKRARTAREAAWPRSRSQQIEVDDLLLDVPDVVTRTLQEDSHEHAALGRVVDAEAATLPASTSATKRRRRASRWSARPAAVAPVSAPRRPKAEMSGAFRKRTGLCTSASLKSVGGCGPRGFCGGRGGATNSAPTRPKMLTVRHARPDAALPSLLARQPLRGESLRVREGITEHGECGREARDSEDGTDRRPDNGAEHVVTPPSPLDAGDEGPPERAIDERQRDGRDPSQAKLPLADRPPPPE